MKSTFPAKDFPWGPYAPTVVLIAVAVLITVSAYGSLPERIATTFDFKNNPVGWMDKGTFFSMLIGYMLIMAIIMVMLDKLYTYPVFPVPMMSAICGAIELFCLIMLLLTLEILAFPKTGVFGALAALIVLPCIYAILHMKVYRGDEEALPRGRPLWTDRPPRGWLSVIFFFVRPLLPHKVMAYAEGLVLQSSTYRFMIPWGQISRIRGATVGEALGAKAVRVVSSPSRSVLLHLKNRKTPLVFSIKDEARLISEWKGRRNGALKL
jgi:hypothetical protein